MAGDFADSPRIFRADPETQSLRGCYTKASIDHEASTFTILLLQFALPCEQ